MLSKFGFAVLVSGFCVVLLHRPVQAFSTSPMRVDLTDKIDRFFYRRLGIRRNQRFVKRQRRVIPRIGRNRGINRSQNNEADEASVEEEAGQNAGEAAPEEEQQQEEQDTNNGDNQDNTDNQDANQNDADNAALASDQSNFCVEAGLEDVLADGTQVFTSTCSQTVQGVLPDFDKCPATVITSPADGAEIQSGTDVTITIKVSNMELGSFLDPQLEYFAQPQLVNNDGLIIGHQHVVVQEIGNGNDPPEVPTFLHFQGLDQDDNNGELSTVMPAEKTEGVTGVLRICTMDGSSGHQPTLCGRAQRGPAYDCIRITMV